MKVKVFTSNKTPEIEVKKSGTSRFDEVATFQTVLGSKSDWDS